MIVINNRNSDKPKNKIFFPQTEHWQNESLDEAYPIIYNVF